jgi:hypothetical protein
MHKKSPMYGIAALIIAAACIFSACPTGNDEPEPTPTQDPNPDPTPDPDTTAPVLQSIKANGFEVVLTYDEPLNGESVPAANDFIFAVLDGTITSVGIDGSAVILTLDSSADNDDSEITLSYTAGENPIQDSAGNDAEDFEEEDVTNVTLAAPVYNETVSSDGQFKVESAEGTNTGETVLTFTWVSGDYTLQYTLTGDSEDVIAGAVWTDAPESGSATDNITPSANTDDVWVRFVDSEGNVSAPVVDAALTELTLQE